MASRKPISRSLWRAIAWPIALICGFLIFVIASSTYPRHLVAIRRRNGETNPTDRIKAQRYAVRSFATPNRDSVVISSPAIQIPRNLPYCRKRDWAGTRRLKTDNHRRRAAKGTCRDTAARREKIRRVERDRSLVQRQRRRSGIGARALGCRPASHDGDPRPDIQHDGAGATPFIGASIEIPVGQRLASCRQSHRARAHRDRRDLHSIYRPSGREGDRVYGRARTQQSGARRFRLYRVARSERAAARLVQSRNVLARGLQGQDR